MAQGRTYECLDCSAVFILMLSGTKEFNCHECNAVKALPRTGTPPHNPTAITGGTADLNSTLAPDVLCDHCGAKMFEGVIPECPGCSSRNLREGQGRWDIRID